jgi:hypothetical protein
VAKVGLEPIDEFTTNPRENLTSSHPRAAKCAAHSDEGRIEQFVESLNATQLQQFAALLFAHPSVEVTESAPMADQEA